ncbi:MAG TPA: hypothetical protein VFA11_10100 [Acidimicrobiales bacterium]|nr:hypothetical protein [Acidimicrobiales bacterium]
MSRLVAVPDTEGELVYLLEGLEEVLLSLLPAEGDSDDWQPPGPPLGDGSALGALQRVGSEVRAAEREPVVQPLAPDGRFELVPLHFVRLDPADLATVGEALAELGRATLPGGDELVAEVLTERAAGGRHPGDRGQPVAQLVASYARAHGLLDLAPDEDTELLAGCLENRQGQVVLTGAEHDAYRRLTERALGMFHTGDPLARFLYRG